MNSVVSVIIPVYNRENTIERCVESIIAQTYKSFEIVMIDDGSTDNSLAVCEKLCDEYGAKGYKLRVIHKENGGVSSARNKGMEVAEGKYFVCVDSDDTVTETYLQDMVELQESDKNLGSVSCALKSLSVTGLPYVFSETEEVSFRDRKNYMDLYEKDQVQSPCLRLYRTDIVRKNHIRMREDICNGEDLIFNLEYFDALDNTSFGIINRANYIYHDGSESSLNWRYRPNLLRDYNEIDKAIKHYLIKWDAFDADIKRRYYNGVFYHYTQVFENTYNKNCTLTAIQKLKYNSAVLRSAEFKEALKNSNSCKRKLIRAAYGSGHYSLVVLAKNVCRVTGRLFRIFRR